MATPPTANPTTLTAHLLSLSTPRPYSAATEHPFLTAAGLGTLPPALLSLWLAQDRLFAAHGEQRNQELVRVLAYSLTNLVREVGFFGDVAREYGLKAEGWKERKATRDYTAEMVRVGAEGRIEDAMVFLWAMEQIYLDSWLYVASLKPVNAEGGTAPAVKTLVNNWTNPEFVKFVDELTQIVNSLGIEPGSPAWIRAESIWARVIELEEAFWPVGGEELTLLNEKM
ncbi:hypothetical protein EVJ58_g10945 [Rhodofomes roseus]|uniref:Thiaminase-2/PQQC domain-containing protein n=1 Tax=Rhodofomes roseus TaxID=34475 RepID=A0A4Y9XKW7_9APHY|nr:hypothetical protein EVJ58_g10945 [Rhodofomes roseus]